MQNELGFSGSRNPAHDLCILNFSFVHCLLIFFSICGFRIGRGFGIRSIDMAPHLFTIKINLELKNPWDIIFFIKFNGRHATLIYHKIGEIFTLDARTQLFLAYLMSNAGERNSDATNELTRNQDITPVRWARFSLVGSNWLESIQIELDPTCICSKWVEPNWTGYDSLG